MSLVLGPGRIPAPGRRAAQPGAGTHRRPGWAVPGAPALLALGLGLWGLSRQGALWRDEAATWEVARRSLSEIGRLTGQVDVVHGLYYLLIHAVFEVFGAHLAALRLPSVLGVVIAAAATAATGRRLAGPLGGLSAGLVVALLPVMQRYAQEGRPFALVTAGVAVATWLLVGALDTAQAPAVRNGHGLRAAWRWGGYTAVMLATALLNWLALFALAAHGVTVLIAWRSGQRPLLTRWLATVLVIVPGTLPLVLASRPQATQVAWIQPASATSLLAVAAMLLVALACARIPRRESTAPSPLQVGLPLLAVPQLGLLLASLLVKPLYVDRYVLFAYLGLALLVGPALAWAARTAVSSGLARGRIWGRLRGEALLAGVVALVFLALLPLELSLRAPTSRTDDVRATAETVAALARRGDGIVYLPDQRRDAALVTPSAFRGLRDVALAEGPVASGTLYGVEASPDRIRAAMLARKRLIVISDPDPSPLPPTPRDLAKRAVLGRHFTRVTGTETGGRRITVYERTR